MEVKVEKFFFVVHILVDTFLFNVNNVANKCLITYLKKK